MAGEEPHRPRGRQSRLVSALLAALLVGAFVWALAGQWGEVVDALVDQRIGVLLLALVLALGAVGVSFLLWRSVLRALGAPLPVRPAAAVFYVGQFGKYVPGAVWPVLTQMRLARREGVAAEQTAVAFLLTLGLSIAWGLVVGILALPVLLRGSHPALAWLLLLAVPLLALLLTPSVLNRLLGATLRLLRREQVAALPGRALTTASLWTLGVWALFGLHVWVLAVGLGADPWPALPAAVGGFALAFSTGALLVLVPAGAGVREALLVAMLTPVLARPEAAAVALTSRGLLMLTDVVLAAGSAILLRRRAPRS